ncbi:MAG: YfhO family protein [Candidatus Omnitrophica bacterium]|jgi:hypothetical protein|nr:YfhO family protein [Candidatus Omnitrophota bacterium]
MRLFKKHSGFILGFLATILLFLYPLIFMRSSFLNGDNFVQFFPWFKIYSESLKNFNFPYWIGYMQSGFPLMAEGQIGGFYPLNIFMFFFLPFKAAYNYSIILHFILGGVFTYLYVRKIGADQIGGYLASLLFCFSSSYGGCFYNIITLRTLAWFPLNLFLFELFFEKQKVKYVLFAGIILGLQFLAGFIQMAAYSALFYVLYFVYRAISEKLSLKKIFFSLLFFCAVSLLIFLPQFFLTYQLAKFSNRGIVNLGFALWGSFSPVGILGLIFPFTSLAFLMRNEFYVGIFSIFFIIFNFYNFRYKTPLGAVFFIFLFSLFLSLGGYNPLYVLILKLTKFYVFRNPSKFLFFSTFALSILSGCGFTKFFKTKENENKQRAFSAFNKILLFSGAIFLSMKLLLHLFKGEIISAGNWYVKNFIYQMPHHRHGIEYYLKEVELIYNKLVISFSFSSIFVKISWIFVIAGLLMLPILCKNRLKKIIVALIILDLFIFSFYGIGLRNNIGPFSNLMPHNPEIFEILKNDKEFFRIMPFDIKSEKLPNWTFPNANIIYDIDSVACYTPLAFKHYRDAALELEIVDDSLGLNSPKEDAILKKYNLLRLLNVKYVITYRKLNYDFLEIVKAKNDTFLYKMKDYLGRVFFVESIDRDIKLQPTRNLELLKYAHGFAKIDIKTDKAGFLVFSENFYPGWSVYVDGQKRELLKAWGLIQAVAIDKGKHTVIFKYQPNFFSKR